MVAVPFVHTMQSEEASEWQAELQSALPEYRVCSPGSLSKAEAQAVKVAIVANPEPSELDRFPSLVWVQSLWAGVERLVTSLRDTVGIVRLVDPVLANTMAEGVLAHVLYLHRRMPEYRAQQQEGIWRPLRQPTASERTIALLGIGELGRSCADLLVRCGFRVIGWSRSPSDMEGFECHSGKNALPVVLENADIIVVLLPLTDETFGLIDARMLAKCRRGASLINVARGPIVHTSALLNALDDGQIAHAILDVFEVEPLPRTSPLWTHRAVSVMPHVAAPTSQRSASLIAARNIRAYFERHEMPTSVDRSIGY
ncbi:glyoxylate/hydroxypyruvate reductase A [Fulvimarina sp. 2208YS6-2-32]|uniref:Glyoxylate/hydroxypyruvate reductase A n=1 Tax=Fulvimarina uroteuthidis TaxID=3098149 RepID=A0ABU5I1F1_9HYPH|nr:glyoxylate/hydroxypyruvate reductase A [Fulvimarina sp. 2208YS6-2-32]MDY8108957.1 glyoxylate/hydroxypyruvate reductase A [Fulvimarina sp. 2208YS6-2-32]